MSEMIERVARAIQAELRRQEAIWEDGEEDLTVMMMTSGAVADLPAVVRAAIEAMREPTEAMVKAGLLFPSEPIDGEFDPVIGNDLPVERYKEMIDAALA